MEALHLVLDLEQHGFDCYDGVQRDDIIELTALEIGGMANGTVEGNPIVAFGFKLPDGTAVWAETTLKLFLTAADGLKAKYGDPR